MKHSVEESALRKLREKCLTFLERFLVNLVEDGTQKSLKRASLIPQWLLKYIEYHKKDDQFNPNDLLRYKRGSIIFVDYGYRIGRELGGCHYAVVLDVRNNKNSPIITTIPISSVKAGKAEQETPYKLVLEKGIFLLCLEKVKNKIERISKKLEPLEKISETDLSEEERHKFKKDVSLLKEDLSYNTKHIQQLKLLKEGSEVLLTQIASVSKQRIVAPKNKNDMLFDIAIADEDMQKIDDGLKKLFFKTGTFS